MPEIAALASELLAGEYNALLRLSEDVPEQPSEDERWILKLAAAALARSIREQGGAEGPDVHDELDDD